MSEITYKSPLHETVNAYPTDFWNDSCSVEELAYAIEHGAVGATSNPTIVEQVLNQERHLWQDRIYELIAENPSWSDEDVMSKTFEEIALKGAELLLPVYERENRMVTIQVWGRAVCERSATIRAIAAIQVVWLSTD